MYDQMRKNVAVDDQAQDEESDQEEDEGCTVEEVQEDDTKASVEQEQDEQSEEKEEKDWKDKFADELDKIEHEPESEFVSNLEELD